MYRAGTNQQAMFEWLASIEKGQEVLMDVQDRIRPEYTITDTQARVYISSISKALGVRFKTKTKPDEKGRPRMYVSFAR